MAKKIPSGTAIRVKNGVVAPEFPQMEIGGWTGTVVGTSGGSLLVEWDAATAEAIPADYRSHCEENQLLAEMACLPADDLEVLAN